MKLFLNKEKVWTVIQNEAPNPIDQVCSNNDAKVQMYIGTSVEENQIKFIKKETKRYVAGFKNAL